jgi:hypothetical protein
MRAEIKNLSWQALIAEELHQAQHKAIVYSCGRKGAFDMLRERQEPEVLTKDVSNSPISDFLEAAGLVERSARYMELALLGLELPTNGKIVPLVNIPRQFLVSGVDISEPIDNKATPAVGDAEEVLRFCGS